MMKCKSEHCATESSEASGYCFSCAEEFACLLHAEGLNAMIAWKSDLQVRQHRWDLNQVTGGTLGITGPRPTK